MRDLIPHLSNGQEPVYKDPIKARSVGRAEGLVLGLLGEQGLEMWGLVFRAWGMGGGIC